MKALELYLHIPFCVRKCHYCDFLSAPADEDTISRYVEALCREIKSYRELSRDYEVSSIFFGGGTPSLLTSEQFKTLFSCIRKNFRLKGECFRQGNRGDLDQDRVKSDFEGRMVSNGGSSVQSKESFEACEITVECNPGTVTKELLSELRRLGVNRLSFGLQSANNEELRRLGRIHSFEDFTLGMELAREEGFTNINVDLMQAIPGQTEKSVRETLQRVLELQPEHISAYSLMIEEGTRFFEWYGTHPEKLPSEETERKIYKMTEAWLQKAGYEHYEISNYAKPGYECRHNCGYWTGVEYLGLGLGASSYMDEMRFEQTRELPSFLKAYSKEDSKEKRKPAFDVRIEKHGVKNEFSMRSNVTDGIIRLCEEAGVEVHRLCQREQMEEFMFLGLRLTRGILPREFEKRFGTSYESVYGMVTDKLTSQGLLTKTEDRIFLTERGRDISNRVLAEFLL